jgi:hypothetical protein
MQPAFFSALYMTVSPMEQILAGPEIFMKPQSAMDSQLLF